MKKLQHPGEILESQFMKAHELSQAELARRIHVPRGRVVHLCSGRRPITADTALRLARLFGNEPSYWLGLQQAWDVAEAVRENRRLFDAIEPLPRR